RLETVIGRSAVVDGERGGRRFVTRASVPQPHERCIDHDTREPGADAALAAELAGVSVCMQVRVLQGIFRLGVVAQDGAADAEESLVVSPHESLERACVALRKRVEQDFVGWIRGGVDDRQQRNRGSHDRLSPIALQMDAAATYGVPDVGFSAEVWTFREYRPFDRLC